MITSIYKLQYKLISPDHMLKLMQLVTRKEKTSRRDCVARCSTLALVLVLPCHDVWTVEVVQTHAVDHFNVPSNVQRLSINVAVKIIELLPVDCGSNVFRFSFFFSGGVFSKKNGDRGRSSHFPFFSVFKNNHDI